MTAPICVTERSPSIPSRFIDPDIPNAYQPPGESSELKSVVLHSGNAFYHYYDVPASRQAQSIEIIFKALAKAWYINTQFTSSATEMANNQYYQAIINIGSPAIPFILNDLEKEPDHWFWALKEITGQDPVKPDNMGNILGMTEDWLCWGRDNGYIHDQNAA